jgi:hypothetical protein
MANLVNLKVQNSAGMTLPSGTTAQRPGNPSQGNVRYNSTFKNAEQYSSSRWVQMPPVIEDGLMIYLDAAEPSSYTSPSSSWNSLVNSGVNATMSGSFSATSNGGGGLVFNGTNTSGNINYNSTFMDFSRAQSICMWLRPGSGAFSARRNPYNQAYGGSGTITHEQGGTFSYFFGTNGGNNEPYTGFGSNFTVGVDETAFICVTRDQSLNVTCWYKNGKLFNSSTAAGYTLTNNGSSPITIGAGYTNPFVGNIYNLMLYNIALTPSQISQIYLTTKGRFGL